MLVWLKKKNKQQQQQNDEYWLKKDLYPTHVAFSGQKEWF